MKFSSLLTNLRIPNKDIDILEGAKILKLCDLEDFIARGCDGVTDVTKAKFAVLLIYVEYTCRGSWKMEEIEWENFAGFYNAVSNIHVSDLSEIRDVDMGMHDHDDSV